ncbi:hypothetical protein [Ancylobacter mangrovi]|uniref:hypothetical protein n=1 Tax=Ancylobacter mangrovi TaxID=2972472 RepID=UPI0021616F02|nr:hypothetical protein [Ancylobacter mangrovi]MCS0501634.1 hypothetical protein [Ancylobacter mangrovi]
MTLLGAILDWTPWWAWLAAGLAILASTYQVWRPVWALLPAPVKGAVVLILTGGLAYQAGRNRGAAGALERAQQKEQARADDIRDKGDAARAASERRSDGGGLRDDDGWRRDG